MSTLVSIRDFITGAIDPLVVTSGDKLTVAARWYDADPLLRMLENQSVFANRLSWSDLDLRHYHILVALHLSLAADLPQAQRENHMHPVVRSLNLILIALINELELRLEGTIVGLTVSRVTEQLVQFDFSGSLSSTELPKPRQRFQIVVDNE